MIEVVTAPTVEPITLAEAKAHLRVDFANDDAYITALITVARQQAEHEAQRSFAAQTLRARVSKFGDGVELERGPVTAVVHVRYQDAANVQQTLPASVYYVDRSGLVPVVRLASLQQWPQVFPQAGSIEVQYTVGTWVEPPRAAIQYMLLLIGSMYENREQTVTGTIQAELSFAARLLDPYRVHVA